jgi:hypothetical protein
LSQTFFAAQSLLRSKSGPHIPVQALAGPNVHRTFGCFRLAPGLRPSGALRATRFVDAGHPWPSPCGRPAAVQFRSLRNCPGESVCSVSEKATDGFFRQ